MPESLIPEDRPQRQRPMIPDAPRGRRSIIISPEDEKRLDEMSYSSAPAKAAAPVKQEKPLGLMGTIREGAKSTLRTLGATVDTAQGDAAGVVTAAQEQAAAPKDPDLEKFYAHIDEQKKALGENPSLFEGIKAVGSAAINNPRGFGLMVAEQLPNSAAALGAGAAGALAGSLAGPAGTVAGGLAGLAGANIGLETGSKALEAAQDSQFTPEEQSRVKKEGLIKGGTITGVDALTLGATKFITGTTRRAVERATTKTLADNGVDVTNAAARKAALETPEIADAVKNAQELAKKGSEKLGQTLARTGGAVALETIGEGAGEYLGELAATGKANAVDAVVEGFAGLGTSIGEITATSALNRKGLQRLFDSPETAEKTAEEETKKTGVPHEVIQHPTEPDKFVAVPKVRSVGGIELERDNEGNLKPVQPVSTQTDFNIANKPGFDLTAEDKIREQALNKAREDQYAKNPIIVPGVSPTPSTNAKTIAGKPVSDLSKDALIYTVSRGSARAKQIATDELDRRNANTSPATPAAPETPTDAVKRIVATGAEKAKEDGKKAGVITAPAPAAKPTAATATPNSPSNSNNLQVVLPDNSSLPAQWDVVDADSVKATIKEGKNQPRDRSRAASDIQVQGIANNPDYRRLADSPVMDVGAPTISHDGSIVGGNGRFEGISRAYDQGSANDYLTNLKADAAAKGIDPARIAGMKKPVLVRRITQPFDVRKLAIASNSGTGLQYSGMELAKIDAERMKELENLDITDSGDIALTGSNIQNIRNALSGYSAAELGSLTDKEGKLSQEGVRRIRNAMLYSAYGSNPTLERLVESTDNDLRNISGALVKAAGSAAKARADMKAGRIPAELDISEELVGAVETLSKIKSQGMTVDEYLAQNGLFGEEVSEDVREILRILEANIRSQRKIAEFIRTYYDAVSRIDTSTNDIFGASIPTKPELLKNAKDRIADKGTQTEDLFSKPNSKPGAQSPAKPANNAGTQDGGTKDQVKPEAKAGPKPEPKKEAKLETKPKEEPKPTEEPAYTEAHPLRSLIESLIKRRAAAKQSGKDRTINSAIDRAKEVMNGTRTDAAREANWFKGHAAVVRKNDSATADILSNISETIKPKTEKVKANEKTEKPKTANEPVRGDKVAVPRGGRILANGIAETIQTKGVAALVGQKITSPERLAELAQVYRNPRYETFRIFFTKGNAIVHASGVTARLPGSTPLFPKDFTDEQGVAWMKEMMQSSGADGYWMLHNHPSGDPKPSPADIKVTGTISQRLPGFKGHVIINSNKYGQITIPRTNPKAEVVIKNFGEDMLLKASKPHPYLGKQVQDPGELSIVGKSFQKEGWVTLVGISGTSGVRAVAEIPAKTFASPGFARAAIRRFARSSGAESIFAHGSPADLKGTSAKLIKEGFLRSAVDDGGKVYGINDKASFGSETGAGGQELQQPSIRSGDETLEKYGLNPGKKYKTREVAAALESRQREKQGIIAPDDRSDESAKAISKWMTEEVMFEMQHPEKSGVGWYSEKFQRALDVMATEFPEIATDKAARNLLTSLIAITSDGQKVVPNFAMAADLYGNFKATGKFTTERGHARQASINNNLEILQHLYDTMGPEDMHTYLMQERTVSELKKIAGEAGAEFSSDYQAHIKLPRAAVLLGPKLGAFYANLMGSSGYLTMDRWWSRTFNRYRGTLIQAPTRAGLDRFKQLMGNPSMSDDEVLSAVIAPHDSYAAKNFKQGTEIEKAANTIYKAAFENLEDTPFNSTDRTFMLKTVAFAQKRLSRSGVKMSVADIQAVLWYYEKRLYGELGARQTADVSYEDAARRVVAARAGADRSAGRTIPGSGEEESLNDSQGVGEEDYQTLSSGLEQNTSGFSSVNPASPPLRDRLDKVVDTLIYNFQDRFKPLKDIQKRAGPVPESEDASLAEERYSGTVRARTDTFEQQLRDPLLKAIHDSGVSFEGVEQYLHALHAPSRNAAMREINPTEPELKAQTDALEKQRDSLAKNPDVLKYIKTRRELRQAEADIDDGIADESLGRVLKNELAQLQRLQNVKDYSKSLDKLKALRLVKPFQGDNTALSGMSDAESKAILAKIDANGTRKALDKISAIVDTITSKTRQIYVDSGLEKADAIEAWDKKYEHYIPLHRDEVSGNTMPKVGQGFNIRGKESKRATGSNKDVTNILAHVVAQHEAAIIRSEKARVDRTLFQFAKTHPDPSLWTLDSAPMLRTVDPVSGFVVERVDPTYKNRPEVLTLKIDGEEHTITFNDQNQEAMRLAASMKNMSSEQLGEVTQMVGKLTRFLATMNTTMNPVFTARNFLRDLQTTFVNLSDTEIADKKREVFRDVPAAIKGMWALSRGKPNSQWAKYAQEFKSAGGQTGWMDHYKDIGERADTLKKELAVMQPGKLNATRRTLKAWFDIIQDANNAVENGARLSAFVHARKSGLSEGKAAQIAKNLTVNFNAHGAKGVELNAWYMFMNASIQGTARLAKAMTNRQVRKIVAGVVLSGFLMDILARSMAGDDDEDGENDYDQLPEHVKAMNFVLMVANRPVTIPMPYGYNFFASTGRKISEIMFRENYSAAKSAVDLAGIFMDAFSPTGQAGSGLQYLSPTVTDPFVQYAENKNFAGNPIRKPQNPFGVPNPEYQMGFKSTSAPGKWLAEALNNVTGGNEVRPGFVNVNPAFFDFAVSSIAGGAGRTYLQFASAPMKLANEDEVQAREIPFANIFVGARPEHQTEKKYFEAVKNVELAAEELKTYRAKGDTEMVQEIIHDHRAEIRMTEAAKETKRVLARLRKSDLALDKEDAPNKSELRKALEERKKEVMSKFNKKYREAVAAE